MHLVLSCYIILAVAADQLLMSTTTPGTAPFCTRIGFRDFPKTSESHPIDQKGNKNNKRTLKLSNSMTPSVRKSFLFSVKQ